MNVHLPAHRRWPALLVNLAVVVVVLALAAATFVLSYSGVHVIALQSGVSARLARVYPATFDAVLVIACAAALMLRGARWWARYYAWLVIVLVVGVMGAADAVHAMNVALPHRQMEGVVAATPWVLVLLGFSLMLTILRHSRAQHAEADTAPRAARASRRDRGRAAEERPELLRNPVTPPALPAAMPVTQALLTEVADAEEPAPTLVAAVLSEPEAPLTAGHGDQVDDEGAAQDPAPAADEPSLPASGSEYIPVATRTWPFAAPVHEAAEAAAAARRETRPDVADADESTAGSDYWDTDDHPRFPPAPESSAETPSGTATFATVPRLNRVRATPIPPEEDDE